MNNREQIMARIERDKARKAKKRCERAHGTWRQEGGIDLELLSEAANDAAQRCHWHGKTVWEQIESAQSGRLSYTQKRIEALDRRMSREARLAAVTPFGEFRRVFTLQNLMQSLQKRRKGVEWKGNVQRFLFHAVLELKRMKDALWAGKLNVDTTIRKIVLHERGKRREIHAVMIDCRVVQGCLCDSCLIPLTEYRLIRDNPASIKGKGVTDARERLKGFLIEMARKNKSDFYVLTGDFKRFFDSLRHGDCLRVLKEAQMDRMLQGLGMKITRMYQESELAEILDEELRARKADDLKHYRGVGLTLGSQESQTMALVVPNGIDHAVKDRLHTRAYERYMDDTFAAAKTKDELKTVGRTIRDEAGKIGLQMNPKKTAITKASKGFKFLQICYRVTETGHLVKTLARAGIVRMRRKLKKFRRLVDEGKMLLDHVFQSFASWFGNAAYADAYRTRKGMLSLYNRLFHCYKTKGVYA